MKRADLDKRAQRDKFGPGKHGFQSGTPTAGVLPTIPGAEWFDHVQEEIAGVIEAAGAEVNPQEYNQLLAAMRKLFVAPSTQLIVGNGLIGGGDLSTNRMVSMGIPSTITANSLNGTTTNSHTHAIDKASTSVTGITRLSTATDSTATNMAATPSAVKAAYDLAANAAPSGLVAFFHRSAPPPGWLKCNGAAVSRTVYAALFAAIGTTAGAGNGSSTFNVPDIRGDAIRGWDDGRRVDAGRTLGSEQMDAFQGHARDLRRSQGTAIMHGVNYYQNVSVNESQFSQAPAAVGTGDSWLTAEYLPHLNYGTPRVAAETRMRNIALLACIKI